MNVILSLLYRSLPFGRDGSNMDDNQYIVAIIIMKATEEDRQEFLEHPDDEDIMGHDCTKLVSYDKAKGLFDDLREQFSWGYS